MSRPAGSKTVRILAAIGLVGLTVVTGSMPAQATQPTLTTPPERLYTSVNETIEFGPVGSDEDPVSGDLPVLDLTATSPGCAPTAGNNYAITNCASR